MARKKKNLDLAAEMGEDIDVTEEEAMDANQMVEKPAPVPAPVAAPSQPIALTFEQLQALMQGAQGNTQAIADALNKGIAQSKTPRPENQFAPEVSVFNPLGERDHPRPGLKCEVFLGAKDRTGQVLSTYPYMPEDLTAYEQIALNTLTPGTHTLTLLDGAPIKLEIVAAKKDAVSEEITRLVLCVPQAVIEKRSQSKNMLPSICNIVEQVTGRNFAKLSLSDLEWFMAEHRAKRYVAEREPVAA